MSIPRASPLCISVTRKMPIRTLLWYLPSEAWSLTSSTVNYTRSSSWRQRRFRPFVTAISISMICQPDVIPWTAAFLMSKQSWRAALRWEISGTMSRNPWMLPLTWSEISCWVPPASSMAALRCQAQIWSWINTQRSLLPSMWKNIQVLDFPKKRQKQPLWQM